LGKTLLRYEIKKLTLEGQGSLTALPDFLNYVYLKGLSSVKPEISDRDQLGAMK
jgi:hypothetical protein